MPIYQGGRVSGLVRQSKELLGQARIQVDVSATRSAGGDLGLEPVQGGGREVAANRELVAATSSR